MQAFDSSSTGADGSLSFSCAPGGETIEWDAAGLDPEGDRVFEFTTITIPASCTVRLTSRKLGSRPVVWLATGDVRIDGVLDLSGEAGHGSSPGSLRLPAAPGPGGFPGGLGTVAGVGGSTAGFGPGAGGAGGGAILIASSSGIVVNGEINANGGPGADKGGSGSSGSIRLVAPRVAGTGTLRAESIRAPRFGGTGAGGRVRIEASSFAYTGSVAAGEYRAVTLAPNTILIASIPLPAVRVVRVNGILVPPNPTGGFTPADVTLDTADPVSMELEASEVPPGTAVEVEIHSETGGTQVVSSTPLAGTLQHATATATFESGFSIVTLRASFSP